MKIRQDSFLAWQAVADILAYIEPAEAELFPEIVASDTNAPHAIGNQPGGFDLATVPLVAHQLFLAALPFFVAALPKVGEIIVDVTKDALKALVKRRIDNLKPQAQTIPQSSNLSHVHASVVEAALRRELSRKTADMLADAVVARLAMLSDGTRASNGAA